MINAPAGELKACTEIIRFQVRHLLKNGGLGQTGIKKIKHVCDTDAHAANAGAPTALLRIDRNAFQNVHVA